MWAIRRKRSVWLPFLTMVWVDPLEFIIANIQVHPLALIHYDLLENESVKAKIAEMTALYER